MRFIGVDLAWSTGGTGLCLVEEGAVRASTLVRSDAEILEWIEPFAAEPVLVAIDAPLVVRNATGRRPCESLISRCFGAHQAAAHSSNLGLAAFRDGIRGARLASALGLDLDPSFTPRQPVRRAIEVYPHPATVALFGLSLTLKYKAKRGRTLASRISAFGSLLRLIESLKDHDPSLDVAASPRWAEIVEQVNRPLSGAHLDRLEDEVDAYLCAYIALHYWHHGASQCRVVGDLENGYIVTPVSPVQGARLDSLLREGAMKERGTSAGDGLGPKTGYYLLSTDGGIVADQPGKMAGEAAIGIVLKAPLEEIQEAIGPAKDHHVAEYRALIRGLEAARAHGIEHLRVCLDSRLVTEQLNGESQVKAEHLKPLHLQAAALIQQFADIKVTWVPREANSEADALASAPLGPLRHRPLCD